VAKRVFQPIAALAAALAAIWAGVFQQAQMSNSWIFKLGLTPITVLLIGAVVYVVKDRMKDWLKIYLAGSVERVLPDLQRRLIYEAPGTKPKELGIIRETVSSISADRLPADVYEARYNGENSRLEAELGEDIIHYSKRISLSAKLAANDVHWGLREIMRLNLGRYCHNLDDPFREMNFIDDSGHVGHSETHRVYHAYVLVKVTYYSGREHTSELKMACMTMDKAGLVSISCSGYDDTELTEEDVEFDEAATSLAEFTQANNE
jgi:hypothetical protein